MRKEIAVLLGLVAFVTKLNAVTDIQINLGPSNDRVIGEMAVPFSDLNGTALDGSNLLLDLSFADNHFVQLLPDTSSSFDFLLRLNTSATDFLNNVTGSGYVTDLNGNSISFISAFGGSVSSDHGEALNIGGGIFPLLADSNGTARTDVTFPFSFYGAHFDLTLPNHVGAAITGGEILLVPNGGNNSFAIGPHVPDTGSTISVFALALIGLCYVATRPNRSIRPVNSAPPK